MSPRVSRSRALVPDYPLQGTALDIPKDQALDFTADQRREYLLALVRALAVEVRNNRMALKPRVAFAREMRDLRKMVRLAPDAYLRLDEKTFKRNVLMVQSPAHRTHTYWSRYEMWKTATMSGDMRSDLAKATKKGRHIKDLRQKGAPRLLRELDRLLDPSISGAASFRRNKTHALPMIFAFLQTHYNSGTAFPPFHTRYFADRYLPTTGDSIVVDPCAGWGGRLLGTLCVPRRSHVTYYGVDPNRNNRYAYAGLTRRVRIWLRREIPGKRSARVFAQPFEKWIHSKTAKRLSGRVSLAITSPPYWVAENYDPTARSQAATRYPSYEEWRDGFYRPLMQGVFRLLTPGAVFVLNIADVVGAPLERDTRKIAMEAGFVWREFFKMAMHRHPGAQHKEPKHAVRVDGVIWKHEPCFVFEKPMKAPRR